MDFILRVVKSRTAGMVVAGFAVALIFGATVYLLLPRGTRFIVQTGVGSGTQTPAEDRAPTLRRSPSPVTSPRGEATPTALPDRPQVVVVIQLAGASNEEFLRVTEVARSLGYPVRSAAPAPESVERSVLKYRPGRREVAERLASDIRTSAQLVEEPIAGSDVWLILGRA